MQQFPVLWLTGNMDAGKTTLARSIESFFNEHASVALPAARRVIVLDGDQMRTSISLGATLSPEDRRTHNLRVARLAGVLQSQGFLVVVAVIAPFESVRREIDTLCSPFWIHVKRTQPVFVDRPYEEPVHPAYTVDHNSLDIDAAADDVLSFLKTSVPQAFQAIAPALTRTETRVLSARS